MDVLPIGTKVKIGFGDIDAVVTACNIRSSGLQYEVVWWEGRTRRQEWISECEIETDGPAVMRRIGFLATNGVH